MGEPLGPSLPPELLVVLPPRFLPRHLLEVGLRPLPGLPVYQRVDLVASLGYVDDSSSLSSIVKQLFDAEDKKGGGRLRGPTRRGVGSWAGAGLTPPPPD